MNTRWILPVIAACLWARPTQAFAPGEHELQRSGLERLDGGSIRLQQALERTPPRVAAAAWQRFTETHPGRWRALWDGHLGRPTRIYGSGFEVPGATSNPAEAARAARAVLDAHLELLAPGTEPSDFVLVANDLEDGLRTVGFEQRKGAYSVRGGQLNVRIRNDRLFVLGSGAWPGAPALTDPGAMTAARAETLAIDLMAAEAGRDALSPRAVSEPFLLPMVDDVGALTYALVREAVIDVKNPVARWSVYVDVRSGVPVAREQTLRFFDASLRLDVPDRFPQNGRIEVPAAQVDITISGRPNRTDARGRFSWTGETGVSGEARPVGRRAAVANQAGPNATLPFTATASATVVVGAPDDELVDAQFAAVYAADFAARYVTRIAPNNSFAQGAQVETNVNLNDNCNAFSDGSSINFFRANGRCENTARLLDVVMHEYGHTLHAQSIIRGVGAFDRALSEGLSDYLAATIAEDPGMGRGFFRSNQALRHLDLPDDARWPEDIAGDPHTTGLIYGGALWDLRKALVAKLGPSGGVEATDRLWYEAMRRSSDIPSTYVEVLAADDDDGDLSNGTPNFCEITAAFERHGLAEEGMAGLSLGAVSVTGLEVSVPVETSGFTCPGQGLQNAELVWRLRGRQDIGGRIPFDSSTQTYRAVIPEQAAGVVLQYRVDLQLESGEVVSRPANAADAFYELYVGETVEIYCTDFERSPWDEGWSHELRAGTAREGADDWMWAEPAGVAGSNDPSAAFSGNRAVGNDLGGGLYNGTYQANKTNALISPVVEVSGFEKVRLQYRRWLNVEDGFFDQARILVDGAEAWSNLNSGRNGNTHHEDREWRFHDVDLTDASADGQVQLAFELASDGGLEFGGWTLDDLCIVGVRAAPVCGNGVVEEGEACDDGNRVDGDGCEATCQPTPEPMCGNGILEGMEACDDGNLLGGDGCEADCTVSLDEEPLCADGTKPPCDPLTPDPGMLEGADSGCGCSAAERGGVPPPAFGAGLWLLAGLLLLRRRR